MKFDFFQSAGYASQEAGSLTWPAAPRHCEADTSQLSFDECLEQCAVAHEVGFDSLTFAEHHYSPLRLTPNPTLVAATVGRLLPDAQIGVFGTDLPMNNPVRVAEEYAMLDNLLRGRLRIGLLRGTPNEYLTYGTNPAESKARFEEGLHLVQRALTEPEPFGWEGRYYRFRNISIWPRCVQQPHPRILISGNSASSAALAGRLGCDLGFSYQNAHRCAEHISIYREAAAVAGWEPQAHNIQYRHFCVVVTSAEESAALRSAWTPEAVGRLFKPATPDLAAVLAAVGAAMGGAAKGIGAGPTDQASAPARDFAVGPPFAGTPEEVVDQIRDFAGISGAGRFELTIGVGARRPTHTAIVETLRLIGSEVLPPLRSAGVPAADPHHGRHDGRRSVTSRGI